MSLFLLGGGPTSATIIHEFCAQARDGVIALATQGEPNDTAFSITSTPLRAQAPDATIVPIWVREDGTCDWPAEDIAGLAVGGGNLRLFLDALLPHRAQISRLVRSDVPYLGWSAGAMIVGSYAIAGGWRADGRQVASADMGDGLDEIDVCPGLGLIGPTIDTHADTGFVLSRDIAAIDQSDITTVLAIDEDSALVVKASTGATTAHGRVTWVAGAGNQYVVRYHS